MSRCDCHDLLPEDCDRLLRTDARRAVEAAEELARCARLLTYPGVIPAQYAGRCGRCGEPFLQGSPIRAIDPGSHGPTTWVADCCLTDTGGFRP